MLFHTGNRGLGRRISFIAAAAVAAFVPVSCGGQPAGETPTDGVTLLAISDSIGIELGDSNYVFGSLMSVELGPDGLLYALDRARCCVLVYDGSDRIWVQRGTTDAPTFDVWNLDGELLMTARVDAPGSDTGFWDIEYGPDALYAYSMDPVSYLKITSSRCRRT